MKKTLRSFPIETEPISCDFCSSDDFTPVFHKMRHSLNLQTVLCNSCGLCYTNPRPTDKNLSLFYDQYYHLFHGRSGVDEAYILKSKQMSQRRGDFIISFASNVGNKQILEVGTGAGQFLNYLSKKTDWKLKGIEPGTDSFAYCKQIGLDVENVFIDEYKSDDVFDIIASFHVLEHVPSPRNFFMKANALMKKNGILYLEVPNLSHPGSKLGNFLQYPHLYNFNFHSISNYGVSAGFTPIYCGDHISNLTFLFKKTKDVTEFDISNFIHVDTNQLRNRIINSNRIYRMLSFLPDVPGVDKLKNVFKASI